LVTPLTKSTSDHTPCVVSISTVIPKSQIFWFENHWISQAGFLELVDRVWKMHVRTKSSANALTEKFKNLRYELKKWGKNLSHIKFLIDKCNKVIQLFDQLEDERELSNPEFNFRNIVKSHLTKLLHIQSDYWKKRCTIRWIQLGGENTQKNHEKATKRFR
jgi:hypothetical protein